MFNDKVVVITGGARGLGKALAEILISKGARVAISDKNEKELQETAKAIGATPFAADVTKESEISNLKEGVLSKFGEIDIWINNAGAWLPRAPVEEVDMKRAHEIMEVNLFGMAYGSRAALSVMKEKGTGIILNIVSSSALSGRPLSAMYCASKHAVKGFTDSLRGELAGSGIKVIGVYPSGMKTNLFDEKRPADFEEYMPVEFVAKEIIGNLESKNPQEEQIIKRAGQV